MTPELNLSRDPAHLRHGSTIGQPLSRIDGLAKVTGRARYAADNNPSGMLYAVLAVSSIARGRVVSLDVDAAKLPPDACAGLASPKPASRKRRRLDIPGGVGDGAACWAVSWGFSSR